jgi:DNA-binding response OmpR family regulator
MVTALGQLADRERALAAGADRYVAKPFDEEELLQVIRELLDASPLA